MEKKYIIVLVNKWKSEWETDYEPLYFENLIFKLDNTFYFSTINVGITVIGLRFKLFNYENQNTKKNELHSKTCREITTGNFKQVDLGSIFNYMFVDFFGGSSKNTLLVSF